MKSIHLFSIRPHDLELFTVLVSNPSPWTGMAIGTQS